MYSTLDRSAACTSSPHRWVRANRLALALAGARCRLPNGRRAVGAAKMRALVERHIEGRQWGFLREARVNVLALNLALDETFRGAR